MSTRGLTDLRARALAALRDRDRHEHEARLQGLRWLVARLLEYDEDYRTDRVAAYLQAHGVVIDAATETARLHEFTFAIADNQGLGGRYVCPRCRQAVTLPAPLTALSQLGAVIAQHETDTCMERFA